ncbi:K(+)-transporting ATPase subunit C [Nostoc ellipsosporum NOK]|nr:K(+)-transporting ATPase subunit C [Nostoc ellipsosporum NOK]
MKKNISISLRLSAVMIVLCAVIYPLFIAAVGKLAPGGGKGQTESINGKVVGYSNVGQKFTQDKYFWGRPSAVDYNAAGSAGSNKGPSNPEYLQIVRDRVDTFLVHNPGITEKDIPAEMVTASGSGLDPHISPASAFIQIKRVAIARGLPETKIKELVNAHIEAPLAGLFGPSKINVLQLNMALDELK